MTDKTRLQLSTENASLQARLAALEHKLAKPRSPGKPASNRRAPPRRRIELALQASEARYRRLFETAKDGILLLDAATGEIIDANAFLEDLLGYTHSELLGKTLWEIGPFRDIAASQSAFRQLQSREYIRYDNLPLESKTGHHRQVEFVSNVYSVDDQRVIQCNIRDITGRREAEAAVQRANEALVTLVEELQRRDQEMQLLNRLNDLLQACTNRVEAYQVIALMAVELFPAQNGGLAILRQWDQQLETVAHWGPQALLAPAFALEDCWAMRRGQLHDVLNPQAGLVCRHFSQPPTASYQCVPLMVQGETLGLLFLCGASAPPGKRPLSQQQLVVMVGEAIKLSLSNLKLREALREQATQDPLTGLFNRRYLEDSLTRELYRAQRRNSPLCIAMLDFDHFKPFNDSFGHAAGDALLREFGRLLREGLRMSDIVCRYGGDEFVLILPDSSLADTQQRVEQIRVLVKDLRIRHGENRLTPLTVSAGVAEAPQHGASPRELLRAADEALYAAKQAGRDRVSLDETLR